jgi:hypothetical protein
MRWILISGSSGVSLSKTTIVVYVRHLYSFHDSKPPLLCDIGCIRHVLALVFYPFGQPLDLGWVGFHYLYVTFSKPNCGQCVTVFTLFLYPAVHQDAAFCSDIYQAQTSLLLPTL